MTISSVHVSIRDAARAVRRSRNFIRQLIEDGKVTAVIAGGTPKAPRLRVKVADVVSAIERHCVYVPRSIRNRQRRKPLSQAGNEPAWLADVPD